MTEVLLCRCGEPGERRLLARPITDVSLAGAQPKVAATETVACDSCWAALNIALELEWQLVESSNVAAVAWREWSLYVLFHNGGMYEYINVPRSIYESLLDADSVGRALSATVVKAGFQSRKLTDVRITT